MRSVIVIFKILQLIRSTFLSMDHCFDTTISIFSYIRNEYDGLCLYIILLWITHSLLPSLLFKYITVHRWTTICFAVDDDDHLNALKTIEISKHFIQCKVNIGQAVNNNCFQITLPHETYSFFAENSFTNTSLSLQTICLLLFSPKLLYTCTHISEPACLQSDVYSFKS